MTSREQLELVRQAIADILKNGQEIEHGDRRLVKARLDQLLERERTLLADAAAEEADPGKKRNKIRYFEPI